MSGHVGFAESVGMIAEGMGLSVKEFKQDMNPITTDVDRKSPYGFAAAGSCAGVAMEADAVLDNGMEVRMEHPQQIEPEQVGVTTGDYVIIKGTPSVNMLNTPEVEGGLGTIAMCVNMIPHIINAKPGLHSMITLPIPRAIMGDFRNLIDEEMKIVKQYKLTYFLKKYARRRFLRALCTKKENLKMAKKGDWVRIHKVILPAAERTAKLPDDTKKVDFEMWVKGTLQNETAEIGDDVTIVTAVGREEVGKLLEVDPYYTHSYGKFVPEIIEIDKQLRGIMKFGGEN